MISVNNISIGYGSRMAIWAGAGGVTSGASVGTGVGGAYAI